LPRRGEVFNRCKALAWFGLEGLLERDSDSIRPAELVCLFGEPGTEVPGESAKVYTVVRWSMGAPISHTSLVP